MQLSQGAGAKSYDEWMEQLNASYGLDKPIVLGFVTWVGDALCNGRDFFRAGADYCDPAGRYRSNQAVFQSRLPDHSRCIDGYFAADLLFRNAVKAAVLRKAGLV